MDFNWDILIWLLIPLFGLLGRKKKKKPVSVPKQAPTTEPVLVEERITKAKEIDSFEEALRQIKEALREPSKPTIVLDPTREGLLEKTPEPPAPPRREEFHSHSFPEEDVQSLPPTRQEERFESRPTYAGDQFENLESEEKEPTPRFTSLEDEPILAAKETTGQDTLETDRKRGTDQPRVEDLQRAFVWREILGPPRSRRYD